MLLVVLLAWALIATAPKNPEAVIRVVDGAGKPIAGATILPEGMRTKPGPYVSGWYGWKAEKNKVPNAPVTTDRDGYARIPYPKYVFERIETGTLCLMVNHPDYVSDRPERVVATALPAGAPWRERFDDLLDRIRHKTLVTHADPIVLQQGAALNITVRSDATIPAHAQLFAQISGEPYGDTSFWIRPASNMIATRRLSSGLHTVRALRLDTNGGAWFSEVTNITATIGQTNELELTLKAGHDLRGQLDASVPRPVKRGRAIVQVTPAGFNLKDNPPGWHAWSPVQEDGTFALRSLPSGDLEIVTLTEGFVSTNGPGQFHMRYPQKHVLGSNDLDITIGMERTARLEVKVTDHQGQPLKDVRVVTWPNVRYGEWSATILGSDCYNTSDGLLAKVDKPSLRPRQLTEFQALSNDEGWAILSNLPSDVTELAVEHAQYALPIVTSPDGRKQRQAAFTLTAGQTNHTSLQLEPREREAITHY